MNLPAHGTTSLDPSIASLLKTQHTQVINSNIIAWRSPSAARRNQSRPLGGSVLAARRQSPSRPLVAGLPPGRLYLVASRQWLQGRVKLLESPGTHNRVARCKTREN
ncbi:hypothetical protein DEO72_LG2g3979 [Vigna unguiculata]|uniref:Uncharacterized protein n=1 Tax=Vigna unguiculata TaxID=3917 RepID=A0A4D6L552_VIGUN|nr:hypothetical protein DEO72_LG2g3979 [Vigna unguiculata]